MRGGNRACFRQASLADPTEYQRRADGKGGIIYTRRPFWDVMNAQAARGERWAIEALEARAEYAAKRGRLA